MILMMCLVVLIYVVIIIICAREIIFQAEMKIQDKLFLINQDYDQLLAKKENFLKEKFKLENEALQIFTLYEITREITKSFKEAEVFEIFKEKFRVHIKFDECYLLNASSDKVKELQGREDVFVFALQGKEMKVGYLVVKGIVEADKEKAKIMGHQLALALRRVKLYEEIERIAITDSLTDVHTRRYTLERLAEEIKRSKARKINVALLMMDVDFFKKVNDQYGHLAGDQVLKEVARIIKENLRGIDIAGRYGGEEFCVVLPDTDLAGAQLAAERIRKAIESAEIKAYDTSVHVTLSIGLATFPVDAKNVQELVEKGDLALYQAKHQGRNRVVTYTKEN